MISAANNRQPPLSGVNDVRLDDPREHTLGNSESCFSEAHLQPPSPLLNQYPAIPTWKRCLDLSLIIVTVPIWLSAMLVVSAWIRTVSPGPLFYQQERIGYWGRRFMILKFRTMHVNAETLSHEDYFERLMQSNCPMTKLDVCGDARLIRGGRILRVLGLDELPQLLNVIRSEMSLVGPRPCIPHEFDRYRPEQKLRVNAPPGLTGYWQVNGKNKTSFSEMISMDIYYSQRMSVLMDLGIVLKTPLAIAIQVGESISRKTGSKIKRVWQQYGADGTAPADMVRGELEKDTRRNT
jgi:lipopolysaccharide/colanic/teichoic acid biosynthesis glycosyltransferase